MGTTYALTALTLVLVISFGDAIAPGNSTQSWEVRRVLTGHIDHFGVYWLHSPKSGSSFGLAILQACDPQTFSSVRALPTNPKLDSVTSNHFSGFCLDWLKKLVIGKVPDHFLSACEMIQTGVGHFRFPLSLDEKRAVIIMRDPKTRVISSFLDWPVHHEVRNLIVFSI